MLNKVMIINQHITIKKHRNTFLVRGENGQELVINNAGKAILECSGKTVMDTILKFQDEYEEVDKSQVERDIINFIRDCYLKEVIYFA